MACCVLAAELQRLLGSRGNSRIVAAFVRKVLDAATRRDGNGKASKVGDRMPSVDGHMLMNTLDNVCIMGGSSVPMASDFLHGQPILDHGATFDRAVVGNLDGTLHRCCAGGGEITV
eukprot:CAMPEP_0179427158 /NCGR_PEP_ID=MMETSP0799-20121207/13212_1 /TAXON_ID=46947 /ORGANISM="Geminigera cryophila, Strain CCMP2564" /LENGTH=116 /DNA_ID=CAMNT_0021202137 /DNA_START=217 /DNA_END=564 /DNA_ORIENTATION=+